MHGKGGFSRKSLGKSRFHLQTDWSGNGLAGQFWQMESALSAQHDILKALMVFKSLNRLASIWVFTFQFYLSMWYNSVHYSVSSDLEANGNTLKKPQLYVTITCQTGKRVSTGVRTEAMTSVDTSSTNLIKQAFILLKRQIDLFHKLIFHIYINEPFWSRL